MSTDYKFEGWLGHSLEAANGKMIWGTIEPKPFGPDDVDIKITHCGICGSDVHSLRSGWFPSLYPICVGHEIVGRVVRVGPTAENNFKVGDRVGVGAQSGSCMKVDCYDCSSSQENHCTHQTGTYNSTWPDGSKSYGGYGKYCRVHSHFVFRIPDELASDVVAPMLCAGVTSFAPLKYHNAGPGKRVGIVGLGGLGHYGVMAAKALGCEDVVVISRTSAKKTDAFQMGATNFIATDEDQNWANKNEHSLDLILCTVSGPDMPFAGYLQLLRTRGRFVQIGAPEDTLPPITAYALIQKGISVTGSSYGSPAEIRQMLELFAKKGVKTWHQNVPMSEANKAIVDMEAGKARYRFVLVNEE